MCLYAAMFGGQMRGPNAYTYIRILMTQNRRNNDEVLIYEQLVGMEKMDLCCRRGETGESRMVVKRTRRVVRFRFPICSFLSFSCQKAVCNWAYKRCASKESYCWKVLGLHCYMYVINVTLCAIPLCTSAATHTFASSAEKWTTRTVYSTI